MFLLANLGADPFNVFVQGLHFLAEIIGFNITHGTVHVYISFLIILILLLMLGMANKGPTEGISGNFTKFLLHLNQSSVCE